MAGVASGAEEDKVGNMVVEYVQKYYIRKRCWCIVASCNVQLAYILSCNCLSLLQEATQVTSRHRVAMTTVATMVVMVQATVAMTMVLMVQAMTTAATTTTLLPGDTMALAMVRCLVWFFKDISTVVWLWLYTCTLLPVLQDKFVVSNIHCVCACVCVGYDYSNWQGQAAAGGR